MRKITVCSAILLCGILFFTAAQQISLSGKIIDKQTREGISGVIVAMKSSGLSDVSGPDGSFALVTSSATNPFHPGKNTNPFVIKNNALVFSSGPDNEQLKRVELFSINGKKIFTLLPDNPDNSHQTVSIPQLSPGLTCIRIVTSRSTFTGTLFSTGTSVNFKNGMFSSGNSTLAVPHAKEVADIFQAFDTLIASKDGYLTGSFPVTGAFQQDIIIEMEKTGSYTEIHLLTDRIEVSGPGALVNGTEVTVMSSGTYHIDGPLTDGRIVVNTEDKNDVILVLKGVDIGNSSTSPLFVQKAKNTIVELAEGTENKFSDPQNYTLFFEDDEPKATIYSKDDLVFQGSGKLVINANYKDAIAGKDKLTIIGGNFVINSADDGIRGKDKLVIRGGTFDITARGDGLKSSDSGNVSTGIVLIEDGDIKIRSNGDGIDAANYVEINGGKFDIISGGGSDTFKDGKQYDSDVSAKGIKAENNIVITDGTFNINSADDGIHSDQLAVIKGGVFTISSGDDGIHTDSLLTIDNGEINIVRCYEGLEGFAMVINDGKITVNAYDDGINVALKSTSENPGGGQFGIEPSSHDHLLQINGGYVVVYCTIGDCLDSNGDIEINGGVVILHGPDPKIGDARVEGPFDVGFDFSNPNEYYVLVNGGYVLAAGSAANYQMAYPPTQNSKQNCLVAAFNETVNVGTPISLRGSNGETVFTFEPATNYQYVVFSSPDLTAGTYTFYYGGSVSGGTKEHGIYKGESYSPGTALADNFQVSSRITSIGRRLSSGFGF
ncbi:MAG: carbohydrate-binding domain-containing protein [Fibrobacter sp.]|nr:carbohydrate-binding domain-containing protein [Fibrobacter sp.]